MASACSGSDCQSFLLDVVEVVRGRSRKSTEVVFQQRAGRVGKSLLETVHQLCVGKQVTAAAGKIMEAVGEVHLLLTLLHAGGCDSIVLITEQGIWDKTAKQGMEDQRPSHWQASWVVGSGINDIGVCILRLFYEIYSKCPGCHAFT